MQIISDRRALHRIPELDRDLPKTMEYLKSALSSLRCKVFSVIPGSLCAYFDFGKTSSIAFRTDADALPIQEVNECEFKSTHPGRMHACGHDAHMAIALELARRINDKTDLPHNILIVFQPAEETTGGAKDICETGIFEKYCVQAIFGLHLWPGLPEGVIASRTNEMMSRSCEVTVDVYGVSSHIARASEGRDALQAGVMFYAQAMEMERNLPNTVFRLLKFGKFESGNVRNALSNHTHMEGSLRAFQDDIYFRMREQLAEIAEKVSLETGCKIEVKLGDGYPAVMNPEELCERVYKVVAYSELPEPYMITEDFSWYQRYVPGMFFFLGAGDVPALHADNFHFNEDILSKGADFFEKLAERFQ